MWEDLVVNDEAARMELRSLLEIPQTISMDKYTVVLRAEVYKSAERPLSLDVLLKEHRTNWKKVTFELYLLPSNNFSGCQCRESLTKSFG